MIKLFELLFYEWPQKFIDLLQPLWTSLGFKPVILGSDLLIYIMLLIGLVWFGLALRREFWRVAIRQVAANRIASVSFGILCIYGAIAFADTLHYRAVDKEDKHGGRIQSVLDKFCSPLLDATEKTYSAPLATHSFSKENITRDDGTRYRDFPRLEHRGTHLKNPADRTSDLVGLIAVGLAIGLGTGTLAFLLGLGWLKLRPAADSGGAHSSLKTILGVACFFAVIGALLGVCTKISGKYHLFGTDKAGMDVFYTSLKSVRTGLIIGTLTTLIVTPFAILFGVMAGYYGGWVDDVIQYIYTTLSSIPDILLIAAAMLIIQVGLKDEETIISADKRLVYLCIIMGITSWTGLCRLLRAEVLKLKEIEYVQAADAFGISRVVIMIRHLVPNILHIVLISVILRFSGLVLAEAVLSYVGIGVDPSMQSWGNMINSARLELAREPVVWWSLLAAIAFMFGLVFPANLFGDAVRDALDPRLRTQ